ncbi:DUF4430 domain-containing protein [Streptomyces xiamenensis]|uniref:DUF4430 domain-containing protein n=1 Tax=Streptomyces sp. NRRL F-2890 TaxID=1463845 RepID=UPI0004C6E375|nr:DUF4430 domain-containing protein [Streptomyces sp. NRRL F-2890]
MFRTATVTATAAAVLALVGAAPAPATGTVAAAADPVTVQLTVTGPAGTVFSDEVTTTGHTVTPLTGGAHLCDGTNLGANPEPGATPTAALDDAAQQNGFSWDGVWYASFDDYLVTQIDGITQTADEFWLISVNGTATPVGGCQFLVSDGDEVAFTWTEID